MADVIEKPIEDKITEALSEGNEVIQPEQPVVEKISVLGKEYTQDELSTLIGLGETAKEAETRYNTKIDRVWPEYTKSQNELKELREKAKELDELKTKQTQANINPNDEQAIREAREAAKRLGIPTIDDIDELLEKRGYMKREALERDRAAEELLGTTRKLEKEIDGTDGRPKFEIQDTLEFMRDNGVKDPMIAYKLMHETELDTWKEKQLNEVRNKGITTHTGTTAGGKQPAPVKVTRDNLAERLTEELYANSN